MQQRGIPWNKVFLLSTHWDSTWIQASNWKISLSNCILIFWYLSISLVWDNRIHTHTQQKSKKSYWGNWQCIHYHVAMANITLTFFVVSFWRNISCICKWGIQVRDESRQLCNSIHQHNSILCAMQSWLHLCFCEAQTAHWCADTTRCARLVSGLQSFSPTVKPNLPWWGSCLWQPQIPACAHHDADAYIHIQALLQFPAYSLLTQGALPQITFKVAKRYLQYPSFFQLCTSLGKNIRFAYRFHR